MKEWILLVAAMIVVGFVLWDKTERFQPEFLDKRQVANTVKTQSSSYSQMTNHLDPAPYSMGPIQGVQTPFQVNQYRAYVV
jgi:hypothetical protein